MKRAVPAAVCAGALAVVAAGLAIKAGGGALGTWTAPFVMRFDPRIDPHAWISILTITGALAIAPVIVSRLPPGPWFGAAMYGLALALGLSLNLAHEGVRGWWAMFATGSHGSFEGHFEYLLGLPLLDHGIGYFLRHFGFLLGYATTHVKGNPPGPLIALRLLGIHTAAQLAALCVVIGSLCAALAYDLGRVLGGEQRGRVAGVLTAFAPSMLLFGVSSVDYAFAALGMATACLLVRRGPAWLVAGAVAAAIGTFFSWLLFAIPAWAAVVVWRRSGAREAARMVLACAGAVVVLNGALALAYGYDPFSALLATHNAYSNGVAAFRPYTFWLFGSPAAWAVMLGLPIVWYALVGLLDRDPAAIALWLLVIVAALVGVTKAETERIWLPFVPLACVAAAAAVPASRLRPVILVLSAQALAIELIFFTIW
jgi:hypothetical protein